MVMGAPTSVPQTAGPVPAMHAASLVPPTPGLPPVDTPRLALSRVGLVAVVELEGHRCVCGR